MLAAPGLLTRQRALLDEGRGGVRNRRARGGMHQRPEGRLPRVLPAQGHLLLRGVGLPRAR